MLTFIKKIFYFFQVIIIIGFIVGEEVLWRYIGEPVYKFIKSFKVIHKFKELISDINHRYLLLFLFLTPFIFMELASILAVKALASGNISFVISMYLIKAVLTIPVTIIFNSGKKILVSFFIIRLGFYFVLKFKRLKIYRNVKRSIKEGIYNVRSYIKKIFSDKETRDSLFLSFKKVYLETKGFIFLYLRKIRKLIIFKEF